MAKFGLTEPRNDGDEFYFAAKIHLGDAVYAQALKLKEGEVSEPLQAADGIHIVKVIKNKVPVPLSFERARLQVLTDLKNAQQERLIGGDHEVLARAVEDSDRAGLFGLQAMRAWRARHECAFCSSSLGRVAIGAPAHAHTSERKPFRLAHRRRQRSLAVHGAGPGGQAGYRVG